MIPSIMSMYERTEANPYHGMERLWLDNTTTTLSSPSLTILHLTPTEPSKITNTTIISTNTFFSLSPLLLLHYITHYNNEQQCCAAVLLLYYFI